MGPLRTFRARPLLLGMAFVASASAGAQVFVVGMKTAEANVVTEFHATHVQLPADVLDDRGRLGLLRDLESEQGFAHRELPLGAGMSLIANGNMTPHDEDYKKMLYEKGQSAATGDRVQVTALKFEGNRLVIDFNGGPYAKHRFLSHISINDMPIAQQGPIATGCRITLVFEGNAIPNVSAAEVKALLDPLVDFHAKTSAEAYADTLPSKVREAIEAHQILVGMDHRMVLAAVGAPRSKHREHVKPGDENSPFWEEWIYGEPPEATQFVRFREGRVVRLEIAAVGKPLEIREAPEIEGATGPVLQARTIRNGDEQGGPESGSSRQPPSLRKPGEKIDGTTTVGKVNLPPDTPPANQPAHLAAPHP